MIKNFPSYVTMFALLVSVPAKPEEIGMNTQLECVERAERVIRAQDAEIAALDLALETCAGQRAEYNELLDKKSMELSKPRRNPFFMGAVGAAVGAVITAILIGVTAR